MFESCYGSLCSCVFPYIALDYKHSGKHTKKIQHGMIFAQLFFTISRGIIIVYRDNPLCRRFHYCKKTFLL